MSYPMSPDDIAALLQAEGAGPAGDDYDAASEPPEVRHRRTELLGPVLEACQQAWFSGTEQIDFIAEKLGDGSRDVAWRIPFGDAGILDFFLGVLALQDVRQGLLVHSLRLVGNSCADTDENRTRVVQGSHMPNIIQRLQDESLIPFTVPVLFNIMVDYEPAQIAASYCHLNQQLTARLSSPSITNFSAFIPYFSKILCMLAAQEHEDALANPLTVFIALSMATNVPFKDDLDDFMSLASVGAAYLGFDQFQLNLMSGPNMNMFLTTMFYAFSVFSLEQIEDPDTSNQLRQLRTSLLNNLADMTSQDSFMNYHPIGSQVHQTFWAWLHTPNVHLQSAACIALGNISRSDGMSMGLVQNHQAHVPLTKLLSDPATKDTQLLHSALGFLKNLAIPASNKPLLGSLLEPNCVPRLFTLDSLPQVQFAAVSLTRLLLVNCPSNVRHFCAPLSRDPASPAHERTSVHGMISLYQRSDAEPTRLEAARALAAICRVLHSNPVIEILPEWDPAYTFAFEGGDDRSSIASPRSGPSSSDPSPASSGAAAIQDAFSTVSTDGEFHRRELFYKKHQVISEVLSLLVIQSKWPALRSEAWFILALMARDRDGGAVVVNVLQIHAATDVLIESVTGARTMPETPRLEVEDRSYAQSSPSFSPSSTSSARSNQRRQQRQRRQEVTSMVDELDLEPQHVDTVQKANMARVDRENAVVLCTELLKTWGEEMPTMRSSLLQDLIKQGTEIIVAQRQG